MYQARVAHDIEIRLAKQLRNQEQLLEELFPLSSGP